MHPTTVLLDCSANSVLNLIALCFTLAGVETLHGIVRNAFVASKLGTKRAKRLSVFSGSLLAFGVCYFWIPRLNIQSPKVLLGIGLLLAGFMALFDIVLGKYILKQKWHVVLKEFKFWQGNLLPIGLLFLVFIPMLVMALRS